MTYTWHPRILEFRKCLEACLLEARSVLYPELGNSEITRMLGRVFGKYTQGGHEYIKRKIREAYKNKTQLKTQL